MEITTMSTLPDFEIVIDDTVLDGVDDSAQDQNITNTNNDGDDNDIIDEQKSGEPKSDNDDNKPDEGKQYSEKADPTVIAYYEQLKDRGYWVGEESDGTWESLEKMFDELPNRVLSSLIEQAPDLSKQIVRFAFASENITKDDLVKFMETYIDEVDTQTNDIETMDEARSFLENLYKEKGMSARVIERTLASLEDDDMLLEEAKEAFEKTKNDNKFKKSEAIIAEKENEDLQRKQELLNFSNQIAEELTSTGWKPARINEVKKVLSGNNLTNVLNEVIKSPKALVKLADFASYYKNGDINYENFIKQLETPKAKDLKSQVEAAINSPGMTSRSSERSQNTKIDIQNEIPIL